MKVKRALALKPCKNPTGIISGLARDNTRRDICSPSQEGKQLQQFYQPKFLARWFGQQADQDSHKTLIKRNILHHINPSSIYVMLEVSASG